MHLPRSTRFIGPALLLAFTGCVPVAVEWDARAERRAGAIADSALLAWDASQEAPLVVARWMPPGWPVEGAQCAASLRAARRAPLGTTPAARTRDERSPVFASWFVARPDSSVVLRVARSDDGGMSWRPPVTADSTDRGRTGCARPAPDIHIDPLNGHVQVSYHIVAVEGAGIFFSHSMDGGAYFHSPVPILYGERPSATSLASRGDRVLIAFEDPNSRLPRVGLAISSTQGHIFEHRLPASDETGEATSPRVAFRGQQVVVAWTVTQPGSGGPRTAFRFGTLAF